MYYCSKHKDCSFKTVQQFPEYLIVEDQVCAGDTVTYGTSDPTINPAEIFMLALAVGSGEAALLYNYYPLSEGWYAVELETISPYPLLDMHNPMKDVERMGLEKKLLTRLTIAELQGVVCGEIAGWTVEKAVEEIRRFRTIKEFNVLRESPGSFDRVDTRSSRFSFFREWSLGELVANKAIKVGGSLIYFLLGYWVAVNNLVELAPHNLKGDVWGAFVAGVAASERVARVLPCGYLDLMTVKQHEGRRGTHDFRKAPPFIVQSILKRQEWIQILKEHLVVQKNYTVALYEETKDELYLQVP